MLTKISNHGPYSDEIDLHWGTKGLLEPDCEPVVAGAFVEGISERDLLIVVPWQQADLMSGKVGDQAPLSPILQWDLPYGVARPKHVQCGRHERILKPSTVALRDSKFGGTSRGTQGTQRIRTKETDFITSPEVLHEELVPCLDMIIKIPGWR